MGAVFATSGAIGDRTLEGRGKGVAGSWAGGEGAMCTGIGLGANASGVPVAGNFTATTTDALPTRIGGGVKSSVGSSNSNDNLGSVVAGLTLVGGTGYTSGVYLVDSAGGGRPNGTAQVQLTVVGGIITVAEVTNAGDGFTAAPTFALTALGAGTGGSVVATTSREGDLDALGTGFGVNKGTRYLLATAAVAVNGAMAAGYLNRSGRALAIGEGTWAVAP